MRRDREFTQVALQVSIALSAGMFSIMPSASAAPVLDHVVSGGAVVDQKTTPNVTDISSNTRNNVVDWKDFSVAQGEMVRFDGGEKTNNYLNVVSGANVSQIDGAIKGGDNVYLVNPNGVVFGNAASVDVGSFYASSRPLNTVDYEKMDAKGDMQPLADTAAMSGGDIVNMGTVQANSVFLEGGNIVIGEVNRIRTADGLDVNNNVTIQTNGNITLGKSVSSIVAEKNAKANAQTNTQIIEDKAVAPTNTVTDKAAPTGGYTYTLNSTANVLPLIYDEKDLMNVSADCADKAADYTYTLKSDLDFKKDGAPAFVPIANFKSTFDGEFHTIKNITYTGEYGGLFSTTDGATIKNVGVSGGTITATTAGGGLVGKAVNTSLINVFNEGTTITYSGDYNMPLGGIVGNMEGGKIDTAYNTANVGSNLGDSSGTIVGKVNNVTTITHVYNTGTAAGGFVAAAAYKNLDTTKLSEAYTTKGKTHGTNIKDSVIGAHVIVINSSDNESKYADYYKNKLSSVSNKGGLDPTDSPWRIYEGQSLPLLRAFLTGHGTVTVNYDYKQGGNAGSNGGQDLQDVTYNGSDIALNNVTYTKEDGSDITSAAAEIVTAPTNNVIDGNITDANYDTEKKTVRTLAAFSTGQQGYDLVGNNYTLKQREVTIGASSVGTVTYSREYNGTNDASDAIKKFTYGGADGIVPEDLTNGKVSLDTSNVNAYFVGTDEADASDVGGNKTIAVVGSVTLNNGSRNGIRYYNYKLSANSAVIGTADNPLTFDGNSITQKAVTIGLNVAEGIDKEYDGKTTVADTYKPSAQIANSIPVTFGSGDSAVTQTLNLTYDAAANYVDANDSPTKAADTYTNKVKYSGIKINSVTGGNSKNYKLVNNDGQTIYSEPVADLAGTGEYTDTVNKVGVLYGSGEIAKKNLVSTNFSWYDGDTQQTASREYSGSSVYKEPEGKIVKNPNAGMLDDDDLKFTVQSANFVKSEEGTLDGDKQRTAQPTKDAGTAHGVLYTVKIEGDDAVNYTLDGAEIKTGDTDTNTVIGPGEITPRTVNIIVNADANTDKPYDGNEYVTGATENNPAYLKDTALKAGTGFLVYQDTSDTEDAKAHHFLAEDTGAQIKVIGKYQVTGNDSDLAKNVNYDETNKAALPKDIVYEATVMEGTEASSNYKFAIINTGNTVVTEPNADATQAKFKGTDAKGIINQLEIDEIVFKDVDKTYDGNSVVTNTTNNGDGVTFKTDDRITITGLKQNGTNALSGTGDDIDDVLDVDANGQIPAGTEGALISGVYGEGSDWQANEHAGTKTVHYTLSDNLWKNHNYKLASDAKVEGAGKINQLAIAPDDIKLERNSTAITKVYNGDDNVETVADSVGNVNRKATDYLTERQAYVSKDGQTLNIAVNVEGANYETRHHKNESGSTDLAVKYTVSLADAKDYTITDTEGKPVTQITRDVDAAGQAITGKITARPLTVTTDDIVDSDIAKKYDAQPQVNGSGESLVKGINSQILPIDNTGANKVVNATTGVYNNKHVNSNDTANLDENGKKPVYYTLKLDNDTYGDYKFVDGNGNDIEQIDGKGTIRKRELTLSTTAFPVKTYSDGSAAVETSDMPTTDAIKFGSEENNAVVALDGFTASALTGEYQITGTEENAGDVNRAANRKVLNKNIIYSGVLSALGSNAGNYDVADTFPGEGLIEPNTINYLDFKFDIKDNIKQTYSGSETVGEYGMEGEALTNFQKSWIDEDASGIQVGNDFVALANGAYGISSIEYARFTDANADTGKTVEYKIHVNPDTLQNYEYNPKYTDSTGEHTVAKDNIYLEAVKNTGIIKKRDVVASVTHDTLAKYYNGERDIYNGDNPRYSGDTASGVVLTGANAVTFADAVHTFEYNDDGTLASTVQTGLIDGSNASVGTYTTPDVGTGNKTINYTAKADDAHNSNYRFVDVHGNELVNGQGAALTTNQNTINSFGVVVTANPTNKVYDGGTALDSDAVTAQTKANNALQLGANYDGLALSNITADTGSYDDPNVNNGAAHTVTYKGFTLNNNNYYLAKADGSAIDTDEEGNAVVTGLGYISKYTLTEVPNFIINDGITKEYDAGLKVKYNGSDDKNLIKEHFVTAENLPGELAYELISAEYTDKNRGEQNKHVDFVIKVSGDNYNFQKLIDDGKVTAGTNSIQSTYTADNATITPRKVYLALNDTPLITKPYDGTTDIVGQVVTGENNKVYMPDATDFISGDKVDVDWNNISAAYGSENVAYDGAGNVTTQDVVYTVGLTEDDAGNYELYKAEDGTAITGANKLTGTGIITPRELTVDFARDEHIYNNSAEITNAGNNLQFLNLAQKDKEYVLSDLAKKEIIGEYTDKDVNRADDGTVLDKGLTYTGIKAALAKSDIANNYTIAVDSVTYSESDGKGIIKPLTITDPLKAVWQENVNKPYDATTNLPTGTDANSVLTLQVNTAYDGKLTLQAGDKGYQYDANTVGYVLKDQGDRALTYTVTGVNPNQGNYQLSDTVVNAAAARWVSTDATRNMDGNAVTGHISPRMLTIVTEKDSKIYNGKADVANAKSKIRFTDEDQAIINKDTDAVDYTVTANYLDKNAGDGITIDYTLTLTRNDNGNYVLNSGTGTAVGTTTGDIAKRKVYVEPVDVDGIDKVYNKTPDLPKDFTNTGRFKLAATNDTTGIVAGEKDIQLDFNAIQGEYDSEHAGLRTIAFTNFELQDTDTESINSGRLTNYSLETARIDGSGTISPKGLVVGINAAPIKEYNTKEAISAEYANVGNLYLRGETAEDDGVIGDDQVNLQVNSANYIDANAGKNKEYSYGISIDNTDYKLVQGNNLPAITVSNDGQSGTVTAYDGEITKRKVYVSLANTPDIVKTYDGNTGVIQDVKNKIIVRDGDLLDDGTKLNRDADVINAHYDFKDAGDREVFYTAQLKGDAAANYEIHQLSNINDAAADVESSTLVGKGVINKAKLTLDPATMSKTYNGTKTIGDGTAVGDDAWTPDKLVFKGVNNESFTLTDEAFAKVSGQYGFGDGDANVSWNGNEVAYKDVQYTGLNDALTVMNADASTNEISKNYTIDNTAYFDAAQAKGMIKPITITQPAKENWKSVIREYNADTDLHEVYDYSSGTQGQQLGLKDILTLTVDDVKGNTLNIYYEAIGSYDNKNAGDKHVLNYQLSYVDPKVKDINGNQNYMLSSSVVEALTSGVLDSSAEQVYSVITPRQLNATLLKAADVRKIYDGTRDGDTSNFVLDADDQAILAKDKLLNQFVITAKYNNKNASVAPNEADSNSKTITYTMTLNGGGDNYVIATPTAEAMGDIEQRRVYVKPVDIQNIDKVYDGTKALPIGFTNADHFQLAVTDATTGIVAGDEDIQLNTGVIQGEYDSEHAGPRTIAFTNFELQDTDTESINSGRLTNYSLETASLDGSGTISPKGLVVGINEAPTKEYDTFKNISAKYAGVKNLYLRGEDGKAGLIGDDQVNLQVNSANYATRDAGGDKEYSYGVSIDNADYKLVQGNNLPAITVSTDGQSGVVTAYDGTITKRKVYVSLDDAPDIVKTYDGNTGVLQDVTNKIIVRDGDLLNDGTDLNRDKSVINAHYDAKDAGDRNVIYNAQLKGAAAGNYEIHQLSNINDTAADVESSTLVGTGVINKAKLTLDPAAMSKNYNGTALIGDGKSAGDDAWTPDKLVFKGVNNESFTLTDEAFAQVSGQYGFGDGDANVSWNGNEVAYKDVLYTGLNDALTVMNADASNNEISKNYTIDNTAVFDAAQAKGKINPVTITQAAKENWKPVIREYNADNDLNEVYDYSGGTQGQQLGIKDILNLTVDDINGNALNIDYEAAGWYDNKNAGTNHVLNYQLSSVDSKVKDSQGNVNYVLSSSVVDALTGNVLDSSAEQVYSVITPRQLNANVLKSVNNRKIYDGTTAGDISNLVLEADDQAILEKDALLNQLEITANYNNENASVAPNEANRNSKTITYTMTLNGGNNNYSIAMPIAEATGDIEQRRVYVKPVDIKNIDKVYDGTKALPTGFTNADHFQLAATDATTGIVAGDEDIQLNTGVIQGEYDSEHAGPRTIAFTNFELQDTDTESINSGRLTNYSLETASLDGSGTISPKGLVVGINEAPTKEYDTFKNISAKYAGVDNLYLRGESAGDAGVIGDDQVNLQVNSANYATRDAGGDKEYSYGISIDNTDYKLVQGNNLPTITVSNDGQSGVVTAYDGEITKRKVYVSLANTPDIVKTYDGNTGVIQDVTNKIIVRDGDLLNDGTELNRDASVINAHYDAKDAGDRNVIYNAQLKGSAAGNYEIHQLSNINDTAADVESSTLVGTGIINKAKLTLDPATMSKTYNGTALIGDGKSAGDDAWTPDKLVFKGVNNESFTLTDEAFAKVIGQYGYGKGDANVSWAGDEVAYKDVQYTGLSDALAVMNADASTNEISKNYTIDNTAVFDAAQAKGKINPVTITQAATENWKPVIREYNADTDLSEVYDYSSGTPGQQLGINDILTLTVMDADGNPLTIDYTATGNYDHKNVGGTHVLNYHIDSVNKKVNDGKGEGNYVLDTSVLDALQDKNLDSAAEQVYSVITPRQLNAEVLKATDNRKIYDGTADADKGNFVLDKADQAILSQDNLLNNVVITAYYDNENASIASDGEAANSKTITYTLGLNDDSGNYQIATPTAEALGDIEQRRVYVEALDVNNIDKIYDGTTAVPDGYTRDGRFALTAADESTGIVAGDEDILLNTAAISGQYASAHVQRDADGRPTAQAVRFSNFTLQDANAGNNNHAGNYYVATDSLQGSGTITPKGLTVGIKDAPVKVYDGETALASTYAANDNLVLEGLVAGDNANLLIDSAAYADANAGKNKEYSYQISLGNDDYELVQGTDKPTLTVTDNGQSGTVTAQDGTITPRTLTASVIQDMTKVYDGTTDGAAMENPEDYILLSNNYLAKDKDSLGLTAVAVFDGANAGKSEDTDELEQHTVTYTLNLANTNYELADNTVTGEGTIYRKGLNIVAEPVSVLAGEQMPVFSGTVEGLLPSESGLADLFSFAPNSTTTTNVPGAYAVYGWYNNRFSGNLGQNYSFAQDAKNETAFTVGYLDNTGNPDLKFTPTRNIYQQISKDMGSGFGDNGMAAIEYVNKDGQIVGREMVDSGEIHGGSNASMSITGVDSNSTNLANIGISGGDVVNMEGADAASLANIEVDGDGSIVNLQVMPVDGEQSADGRSSAAEIVAADETGNVHNSSASIQIVDESGNVLEKENEDKVEKQKKKGNIAIESEDSQNEDEIELEVKGVGVNVA